MGFPRWLKSDSSFMLAKEAGMLARALSVDLCQRLIAAIDGGLVMSTGRRALRRQRSQRNPLAGAPERAWRHRSQTGGRGPQVAAYRGEVPIDFGSCGGEARHHACRAAGPVKEAGETVGVASLWHFFQRRKITLKKRQRTPPNNGAAM